MTSNVLQGKHAFVTGSARGIGREIALELLKHGAHVTIHATQLESRFPGSKSIGESAIELQKMGFPGKVSFVHGDLTVESEVKRCMDFQDLDILICNAGGNFGAEFTPETGGKPEKDTLLEMSMPDFSACINANLITAWLSCKYAHGKLLAAATQRGFARVILIGSVAGTVGREQGAAYAISKAAVHELGRCLAASIHNNTNYTVNVVAPGPTLTERFAANLGGESGFKFEKGSSVEDIAQAVVGMCMPSMKAIHGQIVRVDKGGQIFAC
jgi:NAD(P)-dependent dehydrogenase (short-subunit alcohol dehydrogenase family)